MGRELHRLTPIAVRNAPPGKYADGGNLWLHKRPDGGGQWVLRITVQGRRREMGLGSATTLSLKGAREAAQAWRSVSRNNVDPIKERARRRRESENRLHLLSEIATDAFGSRKAELKGDGVAGRWFSPLELHVLPKLGKIPVVDIDQKDIRDALSPIWHSKAETARKSLNRLGICLRHAAALGLDVDLQATEKARALLGKQRHTPKNIPAMPWPEVPTYYSTLLGDDTIANLAMRLLILTVMRSQPLRHLHEDQIDGDVWTIPGSAMKGRKDATADFRVPLSGEALEVIVTARRHASKGYLFPNARGDGVISDMTMGRTMERAGLKARPHGFRSSIRDWLAETTTTPHDVAETMLAHVGAGRVERAYRRTDFLDQRRLLLERWAAYVRGENGGLMVIVGGRT